jgi:menaquinone-dependent protoporphyrinogen oxidase
MRALVTWGSKRGGTEGIARIIGEVLRERGFSVDLRPASDIGSLAGIDAVVVGGALYANRWHRDARKFVARHARRLRELPVWMFSSGPLDDSAARRELPASGQVRALIDRIGARSHITFGGRLEANATGFPAHAMAKTHAGDWRDPARIRAWANQLADELPAAHAGTPVAQPARSLARLVAHGVVGWVPCALAMDTVLRTAGIGAAVAIHAVLAPLVFALVAVHYFHPSGAREPLASAVTFASIASGLDIALATVRPGFGTVLGTLVPVVSILLVTWAIGGMMSTMPWPKPAH